MKIICAAIVLCIWSHTSGAGRAAALRPVSIPSFPRSEIISGNDLSSLPYLTADGRDVLFSSRAANLTLDFGSNRVSSLPHLQIYLRNRSLGQTTLVTAALDGAPASDDCSIADMTPDGRYVLFDSCATNLTVNDTTDRSDVFVRDVVNGETTLVSVNLDGGGTTMGRFAWDGWSTAVSITPDGRHVLFISSATNLVERDLMRGWDVFVRDLKTKQTTQVNVPLEGRLRDYLFVGMPVISGDGQRVAFMSGDPVYVESMTNNADAIYVRDLPSQTTRHVTREADRFWAIPPQGRNLNPPSLNEDGRFVAFSMSSYRGDKAIFRYSVDTESMEVVTTNCVVRSEAPVFSANGRYIVFESPNGTLGSSLYRWDGELKSLTLLTPNWETTGPANGRSICPWLSPDGNILSFLSSATDLVADTVPGVWQAYVRHLDSSIIQMASPSAASSDLDDEPVDPPSISGDGRLAAFSTTETLVPGDRNETEDVYLYNCDTATTELISAAAVGIRSATANRSSAIGKNALSADGRYVVFTSLSDDVAPADSNRASDVFVRDLRSETVQLASVSTNGTPANHASYRGVISGDGRYTAFLSLATDLTEGDTNKLPDLYIRNLANGRTVLASANANGAAAGAEARFTPFLNFDGSAVVFASRSTSLSPGKLGSNAELFWKDLVSGETVQITTSGATEFACSHDAHRVAFNYSGGAAVWNANSREITLAKSFRGPMRHLTGDGQLLFYSTPSGTLRVLNLLTAQEEQVDLLPSWIPRSAFASSDDHRWIAYATRRWHPDGADYHIEIILLDWLTKQRSYLPLIESGALGHTTVSHLSLSGDGQYLTFRTKGGNLAAVDRNDLSDVFIFDRAANRLTVVSENVAGQTGNSASSRPLLSRKGNRLVFQSFASDLVADDRNADSDVFSYSVESEADVQFRTINCSPDGTVSLTWSTSPGWRYRVEVADRLDPARWLESSTPAVIGNGSGEFTEKANARERYYRLVAMSL